MYFIPLKISQAFSHFGGLQLFSKPPHHSLTIHYKDFKFNLQIYIYAGWRIHFEKFLNQKSGPECEIGKKPLGRINTMWGGGFNQGIIVKL
jgi:hypothetical protein